MNDELNKKNSTTIVKTTAPKMGKLKLGLIIIGASIIVLIIIGILGSVVAPKKTVVNTQSTTTEQTKATTTQTSPKVSSADRAMYIKWCTEDGVDRGACECKVNAYEIILAKDPTAQYTRMGENPEFDTLMYGCDPQTGKIIQ